MRQWEYAELVIDGWFFILCHFQAQTEKRLWSWLSKWKLASYYRESGSNRRTHNSDSDFIHNNFTLDTEDSGLTSMQSATAGDFLISITFTEKLLVMMDSNTQIRTRHIVCVVDPHKECVTVNCLVYQTKIRVQGENVLSMPEFNGQSASVCKSNQSQSWFTSVFGLLLCVKISSLQIVTFSCALLLSFQTLDFKVADPGFPVGQGSNVRCCDFLKKMYRYVKNELIRASRRARAPATPRPRSANASVVLFLKLLVQKFIYGLPLKFSLNSENWIKLVAYSSHILRSLTTSL